jgi:hypothetical protein
MASARAVALSSLLFTGALTAGLDVWADTGSVSLAKVVALAAEHSPELRALAATAAVSGGEARDEATLRAAVLAASGQWPSGAHRGDTSGEYEVSVGQPLRLGDLNGQRRAVADRAVGVAAAEQSAGRAVFNAEVGVLFAEVAALEDVQRQLEGLRWRARDVAARIGRAGAQASLQASERALLEAARHEMTAADTELSVRIAGARANLERRLGAALPPGRLMVAPIPPIGAIETATRDIVGHSSGLPARLEAQSALARARAHLAASERRGDFTPQIVYRRADDGTDFLGIGIEVPLPVWGSENAGARAGLESAAVSSERAADVARSPVFERYVTGLVTVYDKRQRRAAILASEVVPALERAADLAAREVEAGQTTVGQYLQITAQLREAVLDSVGAYIEAVAAREELGVLRGEPL